MHVRGTGFIISLPAALVTTFFSPTIAEIIGCLRTFKTDLVGLKPHKVLMVGGFSNCPLLQKAVREEMKGEWKVMATQRPELAIVKGAVLFSENSKMFNSRKARMTYGVECSDDFNRSNPEHVKRRSSTPSFSERTGREQISNVFDRHISRGDDIPLDGNCTRSGYHLLSSTQTAAEIAIFASPKRDIAFTTDESCFKLGKIRVPFDTNVQYEARGAEVELRFGGTELSVAVYQLPGRKHVDEAVLTLRQAPMSLDCCAV